MTGTELGFEDRLWETADLLRGAVEASQYKHLLLGLLYLKHTTPAAAWRALVTDPGRLAEALDPELSAAFERAALPEDRLSALLQLVDEIPARGGDTLGRVYEYFLGRFASAEGRGGGEFYTPPAVVSLLARMIEPHGAVYDPCCGSGGMFVQAGRDVRAVGQESNPTTWRLARMNLALHGLEADLGPRPADTLAEDLHSDLRAPFALANPPFNVSRWTRREDDPRWIFGIPPAGNANFAWLQHVYHHLADGGRGGVVLANGSVSNTTGGEAAIRRRMVDAGAVEAVVACPTQLFYNTTIGCCLWILCREPQPRGAVLLVDARHLGHLTTRTHRTLSGEDIARIAAAYHALRAGRPADEPGFARVVPADEIASAGYSLNPGRFVGAPEPAPASGDDPAALARDLDAAMDEGAALDEQIRAVLREEGLLD